jgi:multidrug resistance efflux pump
MEEIELRSEEVQEILGTPPSWLVRWGTLVWFLTVGALIGVAWFVQYPDVLDARVQITSAVPPVEVIARADGNIQSFFVEDGQVVKAGQVLGVLQSTANYADIQKLDSIVRKLQSIETTERERAIVPIGLELGELQGDYANLQQTLDVYKFSSVDKSSNDAGRVAGLRTQKTNLQRQLKLNASVRLKAEKELDLEQEAYERQKTLYAEGFISLAELQGHQRKLKETERNLEASRSADLELQGQINQLDAQISGVRFDTKESSTNTAIRLNESVTNLFGSLEKWKQTFLVTAPMEGKVSLNSKIFSAQQYVRAGDQVLTIAPLAGSEIGGRLDLPVIGSGKVKQGQKVIIYLDNYPSEEFGTLQGTVVSKSAIPKENFYTIQIALDQGLKTSHHTEIPFEQALQGRAEIVTDKRRLLTRFLDKVFSK